eukprot:gene5171-5409_t
MSCHAETTAVKTIQATTAAKSSTASAIISKAAEIKSRKQFGFGGWGGFIPGFGGGNWGGGGDDHDHDHDHNGGSQRSICYSCQRENVDHCHWCNEHNDWDREHHCSCCYQCGHSHYGRKI